MAPNTPDSSQVGVRIAVNLNDDTTDPEGVGVGLVPAPGGSRLLIPAGTRYRLRVDMFLGYNGDSGGGSGSTEMSLAGGNLQGNTLLWGGATGTAGTGFSVSESGETGAADDYVVYIGDGTTIDSTDPPGGTLLPADAGYTDTTTDASGQVYQDLFPAKGTSDTAGAAGKRWVTVTLTVSDTNAVWAVESPSDGTSAVLANIPIGSLGVPAGGATLIGLQDLFSSVAATGLVGDIENWVIYDNLLLEEIITTSVGSYSLYR